MPQKKKTSRPDVLRSASGARQDALRSVSGAKTGAAKALLAKAPAIAARNTAAAKSFAAKSALKPVAANKEAPRNAGGAKIKREPSGVIPTLSAEGMASAIGRAEENTSSSGVPKNFRNHPDMENFFRFIYENDLRIEALEIIDGILVNRVDKKRKPEAALMQ